MASKTAIVYLGYIDEPVCESGSRCGDFTGNKIGGKSVWTSDITKSTPSCKVCGLQLVLVSQLYAPLENSLYHRSLFIYACINSSCWNKKESWVALRRQETDPTFTLPSPPAEETKISQAEDSCSGWCENAEDWGSESEADDENGNIGAGITSLSLASNGDHNGASSILGATGIVTNPVASAEIEEGEGDVVEIDSPLSTQVNVMSLIHNSMPVPQVSSQSFQFVPFYLNFEPESSVSESPDKHVSSLLEAYTQSNPIDNAMSSAGGEGYEKSAPEHGDKCFHRFISRIRQNPGHVIRYCRDNAAVLWMCRPEAVSTLHCSYCHSPLTFECQLLSTLIPSLSLQLSPNGTGELGHLEYGSVYVYTCVASCWNEGDSYRQEMVLVQGEEY